MAIDTGIAVQRPTPAGWCAFLLRERTRYVLAWVLAGGAAAVALLLSWNMCNIPRRADRNEGHTYIDFGGQWVMARMLVEGHGRFLYNRNYLRHIVQAAYPPADEIPPEKLTAQEEKDHRHDVDHLMEAFMGTDDRQAIVSMLPPLGARGPLDAAALLACGKHVWQPGRLADAVAARGGPLYPPIHAVMYYPLALLRPQAAYRFAQVFGLLLAFVAGLGASLLSRGGIWWPVATAAVIGFPGFADSVSLAQNSALTLTIVVWGWFLIARGRPGWGGIVLGLLAFKPVWALAFFIVPLLTARWRTCAAMAVTGLALAALTLPAVGWSTWVDWLRVGQEASATYESDPNWVNYSRDLLGIPRRWLDFGPDTTDQERRDNVAAAVAGWGLLAGVIGLTAGLAVARRQQVRVVTGPPAAFLFLGAWLGCFHFMYYDVLLVALPVFLLFTEPWRYLQPFFLSRRNRLDPATGGAEPAPAGLLAALRYPPPVSLAAGSRSVWVWNGAVPTLVVALLVCSGPWDLGRVPWDTVCVMALWLWCGWVVWRRPAGDGWEEPVDQPSSAKVADAAAVHAAQLVQLGPDVGGAH